MCWSFWIYCLLVSRTNIFFFVWLLGLVDVMLVLRRGCILCTSIGGTCYCVMCSCLRPHCLTFRCRSRWNFRMFNPTHSVDPCTQYGQECAQVYKNFKTPVPWALNGVWTPSSLKGSAVLHRSWRMGRKHKIVYFVANNIFGNGLISNRFVKRRCQCEFNQQGGTQGWSNKRCLDVRDRCRSTPKVRYRSPDILCFTFCIDCSVLWGVDDSF
jgi:hypothetical protein